MDGTNIKQVKLPESKKTALIRQSNSRDLNEARRLAGNDSQYMIILFSICTMLNGQRAGLIEIEKLSRKDLLLLGKAYVSLNIKDWQAFVNDLNRSFINDLWSDIFE